MREAVHKAIGAFFWILIVVLWVILWREGETSLAAFADTGVRLAVLAGTVLAVTTWWIRHNMGIYRRKGPRNGRPPNVPRIDEDRLGRPIEWAMTGGHVAARDARHLVIEVENETKTYRTMSP
jgi:hypothetical protein